MCIQEPYTDVKACLHHFKLVRTSSKPPTVVVLLDLAMVQSRFYSQPGGKGSRNYAKLR